MSQQYTQFADEPLCWLGPLAEFHLRFPGKCISLGSSRAKGLNGVGLAHFFFFCISLRNPWAADGLGPSFCPRPTAPRSKRGGSRFESYQSKE